MALPADLSVITVTGSYTDGAGNPQGGVVTFTPSSELTDQTGKVVIGTTPIPATVSSTTGTFSQAGLACTDNANLYPESWAWIVTVTVPGAQQTFNTYLPSGLGSTVDISQLAPYLTPAPPPPPLTDTITPGTAAGGDLSGTYPSPQVYRTHLAAPLPIAQGGTDGTTAAAGLANLLPAGSPGEYLSLNGSGVATWAPVSSVALDPVAADIQPDGIQAAGARGLAADSEHVHPEQGWKSLLAAPTGCKGETFPRILAQNTALTISSGEVLIVALPLIAGQVISSLTAVTAVSAASGQTHGWFALLDDTYTVLAVTADQTSATAFSPTYTAITLALTASYTVTASGMFYLAVSQSGTSLASWAGRVTTIAVAGQAPILGGYETGQSAPPSVGTTLAPTASGNCLYGFVS